MKLFGKKLIIFDLDGTLIDSIPDLEASINFMMVKLRRPTRSRELIREWVGNGVQTLVKRALVAKKEFDENEINTNLYEQALPIFLEYYQANLCEHTYLFEGVKETLESLQNAGCKLVIVTNKPHAFIAPILQTLEIAHNFELLLGADSVAEKKPAPEPLLYAMNKYGYKEDECVMVGDSKNDIIAANNAKMDSVAVNYGYNYGEDIRDHNPTIVIERFSDLLITLDV